MEANDAAAVAQVLAGNREGFSLLVERHSSAIFRLAFRMTCNEQDAEDIVQETFLRAYRALGKFEARANFGTWLHRVAVNCSLDHIRRVHRREEVAQSDDRADDAEAEPLDAVASDEPTPDRLLMSLEVQKKLTGAIAELSGRERAAFVMRHFDGCSIGEISKTLRIREGAAKNTVCRAVRKLREALQPLVSV